jgi:flagellin
MFLTGCRPRRIRAGSKATRGGRPQAKRKENYMALTVTNVNSLSLLNILNHTSRSQSDSLTRLSTGSRINRGADDPAGLLAMRGLESALTATNAAIVNNQRTESMLKVADNALSEVAKLVEQIQDLAQKSSNGSALSASEKAANQAQIDSAIEAIDRIISTTAFNGMKLLDGSFGIDTDNVDSSYITDVQVYSRNTRNGSVDLGVTRLANGAAELASAVIASGASFTANAATQLQIGGRNGTAVIEIGSGATLSQIRSKINEFTAQTGVSATVTTGNQLVVNSVNYGSKSIVSVNRLSGATNIVATAEDAGKDAQVLVNGQKAYVDGLAVSFSSNGLSVSFNLTRTFGTQTSAGTSTFKVTEDGGATFQLGTDNATRATIGIDALFSQRLGSSTLGYLNSLKSGETNDLLNNPGKAAQIAAEAKTQIANVQGRLGGFLKFQVGTALSQQKAAKEGLTAALSTIKDVDYAEETANLNRQNVLLQSAIQLLGIANQQSGQILALLR